MFVLFTDFGLAGPYTGQVVAALASEAPGRPVVSLFSDLEPFNIRSAAFLLPAYAQVFPEGSIFLCVVDPGVGGNRAPVIVKSDRHLFVGPDNGLFSILARRSPVAARRITWQPEKLSSSFHGRDLFAPVAGRLEMGRDVGGVPHELDLKAGWPDDLDEVAYVDRYGNAITGRRAESVVSSARIEIGNQVIDPASIFSEVDPGQPFWYPNSNGLVEIAVNRGSAAQLFGVQVGDSFSIVPAGGL